MMPPFSRGIRLRRLPSGNIIKQQKRTLTQGRDRFFRVSEEVQEALNTGKPVVALETTIYTHGVFDFALKEAPILTSIRISVP